MYLYFFQKDRGFFKEIGGDGRKWELETVGSVRSVKDYKEVDVELDHRAWLCVHEAVL